MKNFTYRDRDGLHTGTIYDCTVDTNGSGVKPNSVALVLGHHIKLDMILALVIWLLTGIAFHHGISIIAWMIGGFVYHIVKNIIKLNVCGYRKLM